MKVACPTCGAEVDFRYDDSFVRVCGHCRAAVVRGDRGALSLGLVADLDTTGGVRLLGVGVSGLADWVQEDLFGETTEEDEPELPEAEVPHHSRLTWAPGMDVEHDELGRGWVWGSGSGVVTVRFETADTPPGPVRSFKADDPALHRFSLVPPEDDVDPLSPDAPGT